MNGRIMLGFGLIMLLVAAVIATMIALVPRLAPTPVQASAPDSVMALQATVDANSGIMVSGEGRASAKPNIALATIGVDITAPNLTDATTQSNAKMSAVLEKLKSLGIADKDIQTVDYSVFPITNQPRGAEPATPAITGYRVTNQVRVTVRKIDDVGKILDQTIAAGANRVYGISFSVDDMSTFQQQARAAAIKDAQDKAGQLAKNAGLQLGPVISITEGTTGPRPVYAATVMSAATAEVPVQTGELQITVNVQMRFGIR